MLDQRVTASKTVSQHGNIPRVCRETAVHNIRSTYGYINVVAQYWAGVRFVVAKLTILI